MLRIGTGLPLLLPILAAGCASSPDAASTPPEIEEEVRELRGRVDRLQGELESRQGDLETLRDQVADVQTENRDLATQLRRAEAAGVTLLKQLEERKEPPPAPVPGGDPTRLPADAKIIAADNGKDIHLVSVGTIHGVKSRDELTVYRGDLFVAVVVADKVFDDKASVLVKRVDGKAFKKSDIQPGDRVARVHQARPRAPPTSPAPPPRTPSAPPARASAPR